MSRYAKALAIVLLVSLAGILFVPIPSQVRGGTKAPGIIPHHAKFRGMSYGEWQAEWWKAALTLPTADFLSGVPFEGPKGVLFLLGLFGEGNVVEITIPPGTPLFFPIVNVETSVFEPPPFHGDTAEELLDQANSLLDDTFDVFAVIDGVPVNVEDFRGESPPFVWGPLPADNILGAPAGTTSLAADAGYYLMLNPLNVGDHVIEFGGSFGGELSGTIDTTYIIHVVPRGRR
jgi:hypothetical protein